MAFILKEYGVDGLLVVLKNHVAVEGNRFTALLGGVVLGLRRDELQHLAHALPRKVAFNRLFRAVFDIGHLFGAAQHLLQF